VLMNIRQDNPPGTVRERPRSKIRVVYRVMCFTVELVYPCGQRTMCPTTTPLPMVSELIF
jgi:hypothetical protein